MIEAPECNAAISAPAKLSPAPVRSLTSTSRTPSVTSVNEPSWCDTTAPAAPLVTTNCVPQADAAIDRLLEVVRAGQPQQLVGVRDEDVSEPDALGDDVALALVAKRDIEHDLGAKVMGRAQEPGNAAPGVQVAPGRAVLAQHAEPPVDLAALIGGPAAERG